MRDQHRSIGQVLDLLKGEFADITISKIRFLESQGLIDPERSQSGYRKFAEADVDRLRWILEQQRDHFLPLKVIKDRIARQDFDGPASNGGRGRTGDGVGDGAASSISGPGRPNPLGAGTVSVSLTVDEVAAASGLSQSKILELEKFGLIEPLGGGAPTQYGAEAVVVAKVAAGFLAHGLEPRHLRAYKSAAEREAGLLEQRIMPLVMQRTAHARKQSLDVLAELINLGSELRLSLLREALANHTRNR
ncbi:MerR family transcriptional regulator [Candidatus Poriferisocius sp.]|uniref:transcriptional regulator FtsR n=1 Tax=Candidatus Poriferisocius sp. TaxID=3101276 RepID=UPI003B01091F